MPCTVNYAGTSTRTRAFQRTKIEVDMTMYDEYGTILGFIRSCDDFSIEAQLLGRDGVTIMHTKHFFLYEQQGDAELAEKNGWELVTGSADDVLQQAKDWLANAYRGEVHNHGWEQQVYEAGGLTNYLA